MTAALSLVEADDDPAFEVEHNHLSFARHFAFVCDGDRLFWPERGRWMEWTDPLQGDPCGGWVELKRPLASMGDIIEASMQEKDDRSKWCRVAHFRDSLTLASEFLSYHEWDRDDDLLGLPYGRVVNLRTGTRDTQNRDDHLTLRAGCDVAAQVSPAWSQFVLQTCGGDQDMADALQLAVGASAFGNNRHHRVEVLCGDGGTGKSTFGSAVGAALGSYAGAMPASVLNARNDQHPTGIAGLVGKNFVTVPEVAGGTFRGETLKALAGGDEIAARFMRRDFFTFRPTCTLWLMTNEPPAVRLVDEALRRRIRIWPFEAKPATPDPKLPERLRSTKVLGGVLRWIVDGAARAAKIKGQFPDCQAVRDATAQYFEATDSIGSWFDARCTRSTTETLARELFKSYGQWCEAEGVRPVSRTAWGTWMSRRAEKRHTRTGNAYAVAIV